MSVTKVIEIFRIYRFQHALTIFSQFICQNIKVCLDTIIARIYLWFWGAKIGKGFSVAGRLRCYNRGQIIISRNVIINSGSDRNYVGADRLVSFWVGQNGKLILGNNVGISNATIVALASVTIHDGAFIGGGCDIYDTDFHELDPKERLIQSGNVKHSPVEIGPHAFIGAHTIILKGVTIGEGAVVGAGSMITCDVPANEVWAGRPAHFIKKLR